jgi:nicotinate-nucleotide adenylyltransferase
MKIGILGGTFDPVHNGHLHLAKKACEKLRLDKIIFIPTYLPPHKKGAQVTPAKHRYAMLRLAIAGHKKFQLSDMEIRRKGRSYTVDTLKALRKQYGAKTELFFITGSDSLKELNKWKNLPEIFTLCRFVVVERPGFKVTKKLAGFILLRVGAKNISSTEIREKISSSSLKSAIPADIRGYIDTHKLYIFT